MCHFYRSDGKYLVIPKLPVEMILACLKPLTVLLLPFLAAWLITSYAPTRSRALRVAAFGSAATVALVSCLPALVITAVAISEIVGTEHTGGLDGLTLMTVGGKTAVTPGAGSSVASIYTRPRTTQANLHGLAGFQGVDVVGDGDPLIYAPFDGRVASAGCDGYKTTAYLKLHPVCQSEATWLDMRSADGRYRMVLLHGDYDVVAGQELKQGQRIGTDNCWGWCTGNHSHIILWDRGVLVSYLDYVGKGTPPARDLAGLSSVLAALGYSPANDMGLRISHYEPAAGGINCDSDCGHMASGDVTWDWTGGKGGVYAAACPPAWPFGTRFSYAGATYECRDRGGWIQCYEPGAYDEALKRDAETSYCWVDLYNTPPVGYGTLAYDWQFIK